VPLCAEPPCAVEPPTTPVPPITPTEPPTIIEPPITPPLIEIPGTPPTITTPPVAPPPVIPPEIYCTVTTTDEGAVSMGSGGRNITNLPPGYEVITTVKVECNGNYVDMTINIPDNFKDVRAFLRYLDGSDGSLSSEVVSTSMCGDEFVGQTRSQQIAHGGGITNYTYKELKIAGVVQKAITQTDAERIVQSGKYSVELLQQTKGTTIVSLSAPTFDVPQPAHPNLVIIGTPLLVTVSPPFAGRVRITMPYVTPDYIDPQSLSLYVRVGGDQWKYLESRIDYENRTIVADIPNANMFLDNANSAIFAVMGITCTACQEVEMERIYDGGSRKAVVLVHGFTTDRLRWQAFIDDLVHTNSDWQVWLVGYPISTDSNDIATQLSALLEQRSSEFDSLSFIMHSMGGIVTQKAIKYANDNGLSWQKKVNDVILAGQPGLGSPSADIYGKLFSTLLNLRSSAMVANRKSPMILEAVAGRQIQRSPDAEYFVIAGRQSYPFTYDLFKTNDTYLPNDGIVSIFSARTVGGSEITDSCQHYFEVPRTHTDLLDDWLSRKIMQRLLFRHDAEENPDLVIAGYNKYVHIVDDACRSGTVVVIGKRISEAETEDPLNCKCGNGVCGEGETELNCPYDCVVGYRYMYICRVMPFVLTPLIALLVLLTTIYVYTAIKKHERARGAFWIALIAIIILLLLIGMYLFCGFTMPLAILVMAFVIALLVFTMVHLHAEEKGHKPRHITVVPVVKKEKKEPPQKDEEITLVDDRTLRKLEKLLEKARGR
jgi:pimeloyl-ACP methyl ester carboxylesterase